VRGWGFTTPRIWAGEVVDGSRKIAIAYFAQKLLESDLFAEKRQTGEE